jgi:hypothetical protein
LKLTQYSDSVDDCTKALGFERSFKALLRRSTGYFYLGRYQDAVQDVDSCLELEPKSKEAIDLRVKITEKWKEVDGSRFATKKKSKLNIVEVEEWNGPIITEIEENKIVFEDVEDEDSSDED